MADKTGWDLLIFRQIDRVNKTMSGDLENATLESYQDYLHRAYASISALQANVESQVDEKFDFSDIEPNTRYKEVPVNKQLEIMRKRFQRILSKASEENLIHEKLVDLEEPI